MTMMRARERDKQMNEKVTNKESGCVRVGWGGDSWTDAGNE